MRYSTWLFILISLANATRIKRDNDYDVKCHQSGTGNEKLNSAEKWIKTVGNGTKMAEKAKNMAENY